MCVESSSQLLGCMPFAHVLQDDTDPGYPDLWWYILDSTHFLRVEDEGLTVNEIDPQSESTASKRYRRLELPDLRDVGRQDINCRIRHSSPPLYGQFALQHNPYAAVLELKYFGEGDPVERAGILFVIPIATLIKQLEGAPQAEGLDWMIPWENWGLEGARILFVPRGYVGMSVLGSLCAVSVISATALAPSEVTGLKRSEMKIHVFDMHKYVLPRPGQLQDIGDEIDVGSVINQPHAFWHGTVQSRLPYRAFCKTVVLEGSDATQPSAAFLVSSGLHQVICVGLFSFSVAGSRANVRALDTAVDSRLVLAPCPVKTLSRHFVP